MNVREHVPLAPLSTLRVGGFARYLMHAASITQLHEALAFARTCKVPFCLLGGGSNVVFDDKGFDGVVIRYTKKGIHIARESLGEVEVVIHAGEKWDDVVAWSVTHGLWGIENLSGIPGDSGAAPVQNIGAYGVELADVIRWVDVVNVVTGKTQRLLPDHCAFGYRDSLFKHKEGKHYSITALGIALSRTPQPRIVYKDVAAYFSDTSPHDLTGHAIRRAILAIREKKFPDMSQFGTAGSFFKNPIIPRTHYEELTRRYPALPHYPVSLDSVKVPLAWILDHVCELKGYQKGNVGLWKEQPLVLITFDGATAQEVTTFADDVAKRVHEKTNIRVEREVRSIKV